MERLTTRHNGVAVIKDKSKHKEAMERLARYEELGEQGMIMELPMPLGKPYFEITRDFGIQSFILRPAVAGRVIQNNLFGKTVFVTLAEAEKALAEMEK